MLSNIFRKPTSTNLLEELRSTNFNEEKVNSMLQHIDINHTNQNQENFLHLIIIKNKIESVKWLIKKGINLNAKDFHGLTALMLACKYGFYDAVDELLKAGANPDLENHKKYIAIEFAVFNSYFDIYERLKPLLKSINRRNKKGQTLLHIAIRARSEKIIDDLFDDSNFKYKEEILFYKDTFSNKKILNQILFKFDNLNKKDQKGRTLLFYVVENGIKSEDIFSELVENGLDVNCIDKYGNNILLHLIEMILLKEESIKKMPLEDKEKNRPYIKNLIEMLPIILETDIETQIYNKKNETILSLPSKYKNVEVLKILLEYEVNINLLNKQNKTALNLIAPKGTSYLEIIYTLLDYGANPNIKDIENKTVIENLINAILIVRDYKKAKSLEKKDLDFSSNYNAILENILTNTDSNLNMLNSKGEPYFFEALRYGGVDIVRLLIKHGSDINETDSQGENIIYKYMEENKGFKKENEQKEYHNNLQAIITMGANINAKDSYGGITLHKAILDCDIAVIKMLLNNGADMNAIDNRGRNILHNAIWKNDHKIFKLIYSYNKHLLNKPDKFGVMPINYAAFLGYSDLVLEFIEKNGHINNPYRKTKYIIKFLKKFHKNLKTLIDNARTTTEKQKIQKLVDNMKEEFEVEF